MKKKKCIYLDQFAISDMIESQEGDVWFEIKKAIFKGYNEGKLFCPQSGEHFIETSQKSIENAKYQDKLFSQISDGYCFKSELFVTSQLISSRIRKNNITSRTYMYENVSNIFDSSSSIKKFDKLNKKLKYLVNSASENLNSMRDLTSNQKIEFETRKTMLNVMRKMSTRKFIDRLEELLRDEKIFIKGVRIKDKEVPDWVDLIIEQLLKRHKFKKKEVRKLIIEFKNNDFSNIPSLHIRTSLELMMSLYSKKESSGDHIDIARISTGLSISDILLTDRKRKSEIKEAGLGIKYNTKVFSGSKRDLPKLLIQLNGL